MNPISCLPVDSLAMTVVLGSAVLGIIALIWKVMQLVHLVTP